MTSDGRIEPRVPTRLTVKLAYDSVGAFVERHAINISRGGIFIRTKDPKPVSTRVKLLIGIHDGTAVIRGEGVVRWITQPSAPGEPPNTPGMGIQFTDLDEHSQQLIDQIVANRGAVADIDDPPRPFGPSALLHERMAGATASRPATPAASSDVDVGDEPIPGFGGGVMPQDLAALLRADDDWRPPATGLSPGIPSIAPLTPAVAPLVPPIAAAKQDPAPLEEPTGVPPALKSPRPAPAAPSDVVPLPAPAPSASLEVVALPAPVSASGPQGHSTESSPSRSPFRKSAEAEGRSEPPPEPIPLPAPTRAAESAQNDGRVPKTFTSPTPAPAPKAPQPSGAASTLSPASGAAPSIGSPAPLPARATPPPPEAAPPPASASPAPEKSPAPRQPLVSASTPSASPAPAKSPEPRESPPPAATISSSPPTAGPAEALPSSSESRMAPAAPAPKQPEVAPSPDKVEVGKNGSSAAAAASRSAAPPQSDSGSGIGRTQLASQLVQEGRFEEAEAQLQLAIAQEPNNARLRFEFGLLFYRWADAGKRDRDPAAEGAFARAAELDPTNDESLVYVARLRLRNGKPEEARAALNDALARNPASRSAQEVLSILTQTRRNQLLVRIAGGAAVALLVVGGAYGMNQLGGSGTTAIEESPRAAAAEEKSGAGDAPAKGPAAIAQAPATPPPAGPLPPAAPPAPVAAAPVPAAVPVAAAAVPEKAPEVTRAEPTKTAPPVAKAKKTTAKRTTQREATPVPTKAEVKPAAAAEKAPPEKKGGGAKALVAQGDAALRAGQVDEALAAYREAIAKDSKYAPAHRGLGSAFVMQGKDTQAADAYQKYLSLSPNAPDAARIKGLLESL